MDKQDLLSRAHAAYFAAVQNEGEMPLQPSRNSSVNTISDGRSYVVLRSAAGVVAVFRVRTPSGALKRLKRWPAALEEF